MVATLSLTVIRRFAARWLLLGGMVIFSTALAGPLQLEPADSPVDNPMKGLVPYAGKSADRFPHSLELDYLPLAKLLTGPGQYHWHPLDTGRKDDSWFHLSALKAAGPLAMERWKPHPIGGEIRPEVWGLLFDEKQAHRREQHFATCVQETHASWVMDSGMFSGENDPARVARASAEVRRVGYDSRIASADIARRGDHGAAVALEIVNQGVAPFYQDWRIELAAIAADGTVLETWPVQWTLRGFQPSEKPTRWEPLLERTGSRGHACTLALRVVNPMPGGKRLRLANAAEDRDAKGWLSLGPLP